MFYYKTLFIFVREGAWNALKQKTTKLSRIRSEANYNLEKYEVKIVSKADRPANYGAAQSKRIVAERFG